MDNEREGVRLVIDILVSNNSNEGNLVVEEVRSREHRQSERNSYF